MKRIDNYSPRLAPRPVTSSQNASKSPRSKSPSQRGSSFLQPHHEQATQDVACSQRHKANFGRMLYVPEFERWADRTSNWSDPLTITSWQSSRLFATSSSPEPTPRTSRGNSLISPTPTDSQILAIALAFC
ncbi:hypothetical protein PGTUg99_003094 [Puccinia graminis f. sp. tritici]|uniref:Uncharacterized protein n=1 Tax=Puccinia graminis f. sp. tritici TaxID=56615 RepID=A0A5B0MS84_PUCGR|nr:hypothetical protein PGTUg99_003094 [Puccinia graminis f. sp. tritici]